MKKEHLKSISLIADELLTRGMAKTMHEAEEIAKKWVIDSESEVYFS